MTLELSQYSVLVIRETDRPRGTGFVKFKSADSVAKCIEASNSEEGIVIDSRKVGTSVTTIGERPK